MGDAVDAPGADAGPKPRLFVPASYDCTSLSLGPPPRTSKVPLGCVLDPSCTTTLVAAHRGAGVDSQKIVAGFYLPIGKFAPENTLAAIRAAIVVGADLVELDVRRTQDGHLVLMHDSTVDRTTTSKGKVSDFTLAQLQALTIKSGQFLGDFSCVKVPTFADALALAKGRVNIDADLKTGATDEVALAVKAAGMLEQVFFSAKDLAKLQKARTAVPAVRLQARADTAAQIAAALALVPPPSIVEVDEAILGPATITTVHAASAKVFVNGFPYDLQGYLTNDPKSYAGLVTKKPDIIQTDRADLVLELLGR